jgi:hypothetical protein
MKSYCYTTFIEVLKEKGIKYTEKESEGIVDVTPEKKFKARSFSCDGGWECTDMDESEYLSMG